MVVRGRFSQFTMHGARRCLVERYGPRRVLKNESYGVRWSANRLIMELWVSG